MCTLLYIPYEIEQIKSLDQKEYHHLMMKIKYYFKYSNNLTLLEKEKVRGKWKRMRE